MFLAATIVCTATLASAQPAPTASEHRDAATLHADDCARARALHRTCVLDIKGDDIDGSVPAGGGTVIQTREWSRASSLVHLRRDFITEIIKTAEDL
ncbi:MAG: hypothetical protein ABI437_28495 [Kofleriaceae bacterium]